MKNLIKVIALAVLGFGLNLQAATWSGTIAADFTNVVTSGGVLQSLTLSSTGAATRVTIWDSGTVSNHIAIATYTNAAITAYTATVTYTNTFGTTNTGTYTYTAVTNALTRNAGNTTRTYPVVWAGTISSNNVVTLNFSGMSFNRGLLLTNTGGGTFTVTYSSN